MSTRNLRFQAPDTAAKAAKGSPLLEAFEKFREKALEDGEKVRKTVEFYGKC